MTNMTCIKQRSKLLKKRQEAQLNVRENVGEDREGNEVSVDTIDRGVRINRMRINRII
jgi:hypothetical protein